MSHSPSVEEVEFGAEVLGGLLPELYGVVCVKCCEAAQIKTDGGGWPYTLATTGVCSPEIISRIDRDRNALQVISSFRRQLDSHHHIREIGPRTAREFAHRLLLGVPAMNNFGENVLHCPPCENVALAESNRLARLIHRGKDLNPEYIGRAASFGDILLTVEVVEVLTSFNNRVSLAHLRHNPPKVVNLRGNETEQETD